MSSVQWIPIEDLPPNWSEPRSPDLESLAQVWKDQAVKLLTQPISMTDEVFEFTYNENQEALVGRFDNWLNKAMVNALKLWRRQIF